MPSGEAANGMGFGDVKDLLRRQWLPVVLCLLLGLAAAFVYVQAAPREYRAQTSVLVTATAGTASPQRNTTINLETEAQLVRSTGTVAAAAELLDVSPSQLESLARRVTVNVPPSSEILEITYTGGTAEAARQGAQAFAEAYLDQRLQAAQAALTAEDEALQNRIDAVTQQLEATLAVANAAPATSPTRSRANSQIAALNGQLASLSSQQSQIRSTSVTPGRIVTQPTLPSSPSSPDAVLALAAGALLGLLVGLVVAVVRHRADDVIRTSADLHRQTDVPVITELSEKLPPRRVRVVSPLTADGRGYARLRNLVTTSLEGNSRRVVLVAGVRRGGGPVAANLAASLARAGEDVFLVCADVFGDTSTALLGGPPAAGLAEVLAGERDVDSVVRRMEGLPNLRILGVGQDPDRADALLQTRSPRRLIDRLLESATYVVIEVPPTTDSPDAQTLANVAQLAVLVVETGATAAGEVLDACAQLESMGTPVLGAVLARYGRDSGGDSPRPPQTPADGAHAPVGHRAASRGPGSSAAKASTAVAPGTRTNASP